MYFDKTADQILQCIICGDDTTLHCMRCHKPYCSKACQRLDWNGVGDTATKQKAELHSKKRFGDHKVICYKLAGPNNVWSRGSGRRHRGRPRPRARLVGATLNCPRRNR